LDEKEEKIMHFKAKINRKTGFYTLMLLTIMLIFFACTAQDLERIFTEGQSSASADPVIEQFEANPPGAVVGDTSTLRWRTRNTVNVNISGIGNVPSNGEQEVDPGRSYKLTATGSSGKSVSEERFIAAYSYAIIEESPKPPPSLNEQPAVKPDKVIKPIKPLGTLSIQALSPPAQRSPANGKRFVHYPRRMTLNWNAVPGAAAYTVEIDCHGCCQSGKWCTDIGKTYTEVQSINAITYTFNFVGAQPGRWRVWAVDQKGNPGKKSPWWTFSFTR
jgi:hypothetical protein